MCIGFSVFLHTAAASAPAGILSSITTSVLYSYIICSGNFEFISQSVLFIDFQLP